MAGERRPDLGRLHHAGVIDHGIEAPAALTVSKEQSMDIQPEPAPNRNLTGLRPYKANNSYWEYRGKPMWKLHVHSKGSLDLREQ